jgi:hypothetical protein
LEELLYVASILRENRGLLILLVGGVISMMMALLAGLEDVNLLRAFMLSLSCYFSTTILVARSARSIVSNNAQVKGETLSRAELKHIMGSIPEESFVDDAEVDHCDSTILEKMLHNRSMESAAHITSIEKDSLIRSLKKKRNYNDDCCICLSAFKRGDTIRVLPLCHHEFHKYCIDKWALTFVAKQYDFNSCNKRGRPTCPLCNTTLMLRKESAGCDMKEKCL